jgi:ComF family protein
MLQAAYSLRTLLGNMLFPPYCLLCHGEVDASATVCTDCFSQLRMISRPYCEQCGQPFAYETGETLCAECQFSPPQFNAARSVWCYNDFSTQLIKKLKYGDHTRLAPYLGGMMRGAGAELLEYATLMTPVPLHRKRLRHRRYNQSFLLAKAIDGGRSSELTLIPDLLQRTRHTVPQTLLTHAERQTNVIGVFSVNVACREIVENARIILIDDVMTTGATLNACAEALQNAGAAWVGVLTLAKRIR